MKFYFLCAVVALGAMSLCSCGSSKKLQKSSIKTFVMPCSELVSGDGMLRAWASGKSDSEMSARKKAQMAAATDLATMLERVVKVTIEEYSAILSEKDASGGKSFLSEKAKVAVKQSLKGVTIVCDRWVKDEVTGQYTNYLVLELRGDEYLKNLYEELNKDKSASVNEQLLQDVFIKQINQTEQ